MIFSLTGCQIAVASVERQAVTGLQTVPGEGEAQLINKQEGVVVGFSFLIDLTFLNGKEVLLPYCKEIVSLVEY